MVTATLHVVGALGATFLYGVLILLFDAWLQKRATERHLQNVSIALGVPLSSIENDDSFAPQLIQYSAQRYSSELLRNRLSDLCGSLRTLWNWGGAIAQIVVIGGASWAMYTEGAQNATIMWFVPVAAVFFSLVGVAFSFSCLLVTGRYPGEAKLGRKAVAQLIGE